MKRCFRWALALLVSAMAFTARAETTITVASFPSFDESTKAAIPLWEKKHPDVKIKLVSLAFGDHHNAMITALASGSNLPDVMAVEIGFIGRFAESGGLEDLGKAPYNGKPLLSKLLKFTGPQATSGSGILAAIPADVGPGTLFYRKDILDKAGVSEAELIKSWESYIEAGKKVKAATGAYLLAHANDIKDIYIRANLKDGEGIYFDKAGKVLVNSPRFEKAFEYAKMARAAGIDAKVGAWSNEWAEGFKRGTIASQAIGRVAGRPPEQLAGSGHQGPVARGAAPQRRVRDLGRLVLRHPQEGRAQDGSLGIHQVHVLRQGAAAQRAEVPRRVAGPPLRPG